MATTQRSFRNSSQRPCGTTSFHGVGTHILRLAHPVVMRGQVGQDSVYEYILRGTELALAVLAAAIWSLTDRSRTDYRNLNAWLRLFVRAALAAEMLFYGLAKMPPAQFGVLSLYREAQPLGQLWPMAMLWDFMATSPGYTLLCGLVETAGGLLLIPRRTVAVGALISTGAMANVLALNVFYDVNQKIRCLYYLLLALYLAAPQLVRLWRLLVLQRVTAPAVEPRVRGPQAVRVAASFIPLLFAVVLMVHFIPSDLYRYNLARRTNALRGSNYGIWRVDSFVVSDTNKPLLTEALFASMHVKPGQDRWRKVFLMQETTCISCLATMCMTTWTRRMIRRPATRCSPTPGTISGGAGSTFSAHRQQA